MFSKSLYIPSNGTLCKTKKGAAIPEIKDMANQVQRLDKYGLEFQSSLNIKYQVAKIYKEFDEYMNDVDFSKAASPFITNSFHIQRKHAYKELKNLIKNLPFTDRMTHLQKFYEKVDRELLMNFRLRLKEPYVDLVFQKHYNLPKNVNVTDIKEAEAYNELYNLSVIIAIWTIEVEASADLIERATLYELYQPKNEKKDLIENLKSKTKTEDNKFNVEGFTKKLLKNILIGLIKKLSGFFSSKGLNFTSVSWSACVGVLYYIVGQAAMPWTILLGSINIPWICGGFLASKLLDKIGQKITRTEVIKDLQFLQDAIQQSTEELMASYQEVNNMINKCLKSESEKELEFFKGSLQVKIDSILEERKTNLNGSSKSMNKSRLDLSMLTTQEEDEWVICDIKEENVDESEDIEL
jgi:hypothetical protein